MLNDTPPLDVEIAPTTEDIAPVMRAYGLFLMGLMLSIVPIWYVSGCGMTLLLIAVFYTAFLKAPDDEKPLTRNHKTWLVRTFWLSGFLFFLCMLVAVSVISPNIDIDSLNQIIALSEQEGVDPAQVESLIAEFKTKNQGIVIWGNLLAYAPLILYTGARLLRGYRRLDKFEPIQNVKTWLV